MALSFLILFVILLSSGVHSAHYLGTGRGVIGIVPVGSYFEPREIPFSYLDEGQQWVMETDSRFPNGVFLRWGGLTWDVSGFTAKVGAQIIMYNKKNTLAETKNQRWVYNSAKQLEIIMNSNLVATVSATGTVILASKSPLALYQKFHPVHTEDLARVSVYTNYDDCIRVTAMSVFGRFDVQQCLSSATSNTHFLPKGATITIRDVFDNVLVSDYVVRNSTELITVLKPNPTPLPDMAARWTGWSRVEEPTQDASVWLDFSHRVVTGYGSDYNGDFTVLGSYDVAYNLVTFTKSYSSPPSDHICQSEPSEHSKLVGWCQLPTDVDSFYWEISPTN